MAYLKAYAATGDQFYLDAAREAAEALVYGQLESGGWTQVIHFGPAKRLGKYRNGKGGSWNVSSLDDGQTQAALQMLIRADRALGLQARRDPRGRPVRARRPAQGAVPQRRLPAGVDRPRRSRSPCVKARFPDYDWKTEGRVKNYWDYYTLNDDLAGTVADTLIAAHRGLQGREVQGRARRSSATS